MFWNVHAFSSVYSQQCKRLPEMSRPNLNIVVDIKNWNKNLILEYNMLFSFVLPNAY